MIARMRLQRFFFPLPASLRLDELFPCFAGRAGCLFFDSAAADHPESRSSYLLFNPAAQISYDARQPFAALRTALEQAALPAETDPAYPPFQGGLAGMLSYDLARDLEDLPSHAQDIYKMPHFVINIYDQGFSYDHSRHQGWYFCHAADKNAAQIRFDKVLEAPQNVQALFDGITLDWQADCSRADYLSKIKTVQDYILAGDIFQANLTQRFTAKLPQEFDMARDAATHYLHLRKTSPAPFGFYMRGDDFTLSSASPERFISCAADGAVLTQPIKGTAPRCLDDPARDEAAKEALRASEKDRAENIMITDLLRNDLSKSCADDSIAVPKLCAVESFAQVHHLVSSVTGKLAAGSDVFDLLEGAYPGGSITGAPKIRAIEIIDELEPTQRGAYCGCALMIGADGFMDSNILIRSLIFKDDQVSAHAGGGITLSSEPEAEYQELLDKAAGLFASFKGFSAL